MDCLGARSQELEARSTCLSEVINNNSSNQHNQVFTINNMQMSEDLLELSGQMMCNQEAEEVEINQLKVNESKLVVPSMNNCCLI